MADSTRDKLLHGAGALAARTLPIFIALGIGAAAVTTPSVREAVFDGCEGAFGPGHGWTYVEPE